MQRVYLVSIAAVIMVAFTVGTVAAHCEIPCGIYDDSMRVEMIAEHIATVEKSMNQIVELSSQKTINYNQLVRWVTNKEHHANEIQHIVSQYFLTQRIKPDTKDYAKKLTVLHQMMLAAMKCKQTTDLAQVSALRSLLQEFEVLYFGHTHQ